MFRSDVNCRESLKLAASIGAALAMAGSGHALVTSKMVGILRRAPGTAGKTEDNRIEGTFFCDSA